MKTFNIVFHRSYEIEMNEKDWEDEEEMQEKAVQLAYDYLDEEMMLGLAPANPDGFSYTIEEKQ